MAPLSFRTVQQMWRKRRRKMLMKLLWRRDMRLRMTMEIDRMVVKCTNKCC